MPEKKCTKNMKGVGAPRAILREWFISFLDSSMDSIRVVGKDTSKWNEHQEFDLISTSAIAQRISARRMATASGSVYGVEESLNMLQMEKLGFSRETIHAFSRGFPADWEDILLKEQRSRRSSELPVARLKSPTTEEDEESVPYQCSPEIPIPSVASAIPPRKNVCGAVVKKRFTTKMEKESNMDHAGPLPLSETSSLNLKEPDFCTSAPSINIEEPTSSSSYIGATKELQKSVGNESLSLGSEAEKLNEKTEPFSAPVFNVSAASESKENQPGNHVMRQGVSSTSKVTSTANIRKMLPPKSACDARTRRNPNAYRAAVEEDIESLKSSGTAGFSLFSKKPVQDALTLMPVEWPKELMDAEFEPVCFKDTTRAFRFSIDPRANLAAAASNEASLSKDLKVADAINFQAMLEQEKQLKKVQKELSKLDFRSAKAKVPEIPEELRDDAVYGF